MAAQLQIKTPLAHLCSIFLLTLLPACSTQIKGNPTHSSIQMNTCKTIKQESESSLDPQNIQLISWNVFKGKLPGWSNDLQIFSNDKSIVLLQEASLKALEKVLKSQNESESVFQGGWHWQFAPGYKIATMQTGVLTYSATHALSYCHLKHKEPWLRSPKATLVTTYAIKGQQQSLLVANLHGINFTLGTKAYRKQLEDLSKIISRHQGPVVVAGDFNSWSDKRDKTIEQVFEQLQLKKTEFTIKGRKLFFGHALDQVFYRGLKITARKVYKVESSDHNPIQVNFKVAPVNE